LKKKNKIRYIHNITKIRCLFFLWLGFGFRFGFRFCFRFGFRVWVWGLGLGLGFYGGLGAEPPIEKKTLDTLHS